MHQFVGLTFDGVFIPGLKLRCCNCGLRVNRRAAQQLEGLDCR